MAFPMMPTAQWDIVRKMGPLELNKAAMGEYQEQGVSPVFALARIKEETALAAAFQAQAQKRQQEEEAKMKGVPVEELPETIAEGMLRERGIAGVDPSVEREISPDKMAALQGGIASGAMEERPMAVEGPPSMMAYGGGLIPRMAYGGLIPGYHMGHLVGDPDHGIGPGEHSAEESPTPESERIAALARRLSEEEAELARLKGLNPRLVVNPRTGRSIDDPVYEGPSMRGLEEDLGDYVSPFASEEERLEWMRNPRSREALEASLRDASDSFLREGREVRTTAPTREELMEYPPYADIVEEMEAVGYTTPNTGQFGTPQVPGTPQGSDQPQVPEVDVSGVRGDIEYSRYSDSDSGPSSSSVYNAMSQLSKGISGIQREYGPDKQRRD